MDGKMKGWMIYPVFFFNVTDLPCSHYGSSSFIPLGLVVPSYQQQAVETLWSLRSNLATLICSPPVVQPTVIKSWLRPESSPQIEERGRHLFSFKWMIKREDNTASLLSKSENTGCTVNWAAGCLKTQQALKFSQAALRASQPDETWFCGSQKKTH